MRLAALLAFSVGAGVASAGDIDAIFAPLADAKSPGVAVLVRRDGRTVFDRGYGVRDLRTLDRIDAKTDFRLASFTKQFTAMAIMLLVHDGKLRYDQRLTEVFPDFPAYGQAIAIRHLLTHTSGLPDYEDLMQPDTWTAAHQIQDAEVLGLLERQTSGKFAPGTSWVYSNSGYVVLGLMVAKVSGQPFGKFLHDRIFQPLRMSRTLVYINGKNTVPNRAYGHSKEGDHFVETDQSSTSATQGDGGIYSNLEDLARWDGALESHSLLSEAEMQVALTPIKLNDGSPPASYGFGWFLDPFEGRPRMWHTGGTMGFRTVIERFTRDKVTIVVLCNRTDLDTEKLALQAAQVLPISDEAGSTIFDPTGAGRSPPEALAPKQ
ncbi:MAG TPA: serine hydrolase domain-containing protein [Bryobacteraceae bacterium]|nr:serine hydrolase domain-containing protein [Bryobacteraceae bacterium]